MEAVCGLCLSKDCHIKSIADYEIQKNHPGELQSLIMEATGIEMMNENDLAKGICISCTKMVVSVIKFRRKCQRIHEAIKTMGQSLIKDREKPLVPLVLDNIEPHVMDEERPEKQPKEQPEEQPEKLSEERPEELSEERPEELAEQRPEERPDSPDSFTWEEDEESKLFFSQAPFSFETPFSIDKSTRKTPEKKVNKTQKRFPDSFTWEETTKCESFRGAFVSFKKFGKIKNKPKKIKNKPIKKIKNKPKTKNNEKPKKRKHKQLTSGLCEICGIHFNYLRPHMSQHIDDSVALKYKCGFCDRRFRSSGNLRKHEKKHGERTLSCDICGKMWHQKPQLLKHILTHTNERPFSCEICHRRFRIKQNLKLHFINMHANNKPHGCEICGKVFARRPGLSQHMKSHMKL